jgi:pimeloyl-ACP methyl ester carboxylesterase
MNTTRTPVVFIHGLWLHASSWDPWVDLFTAEGYAPVAPGWPGVPETAELARAHPDPSPTTASKRSPRTTPASSTGCRPGLSSSGTPSAA